MTSLEDIPRSLAISWTRFLAILNRFYEVRVGRHGAPEGSPERPTGHCLLHAGRVAHICAAARVVHLSVQHDAVALEGEAPQVGLGSARPAADARALGGYDGSSPPTGSATSAGSSSPSGSAAAGSGSSSSLSSGSLAVSPAGISASIGPSASASSSTTSSASASSSTTSSATSVGISSPAASGSS